MPSAPAFWGREAGLAADLLLPISAAWDAAGRLRRALARPLRAPSPVICIGNLVAGGAGKTPVTLALGDWFAARGITAHVVARGYRGRLAGPIRVDPSRHDAGEVGDEALLLAARLPAWIARDRAAGVAAAAAGAAAILLDDGFQNPTIDKALSLLVVDAGYGFGNQRVMPAGPLRENLRRGLARADAAVLLAVCAEERPAIRVDELTSALPVIPAVLTPIAGERFAGERVHAFAGIGRPARFFATLRALGAKLEAEHPFPDHCRYRESDIKALWTGARGARARLVTTTKDFVRLPLALRASIDVLEVEVQWPDPAALAGILAPVVLSAGGDANPVRSAL